MPDRLENVSLKVRNYKCYGEDDQGFEKILPINLIIGRNNSGKSALLDLIAYACGPTSELEKSGHKGSPPSVSFSDLLTTTELQAVFPPNMSGGELSHYGSHWHYGKQWVGKRATFDLLPNGIAFRDTDPPFETNLKHYEKTIADRKQNPFNGLVFRRLHAERDVLPEPDSPIELNYLSSGRGVTNIVQHFLNKGDKPRDLIEDTLLAQLQSILQPDIQVREIVVRQQPGLHIWELYFREVGKGLVPLSATGSGIKTILLALVFVSLLPKQENIELKNYLFGFEELENNLHPALQRRLWKYLRDMAVQHGFKLFLTTHSSVAIDLFAKDDQAQILHVLHDGKSGKVKQGVTFFDNKAILEDLDVRASDLLQANGIVWVEGPSDRLYFNRWVEIWSEGKLLEGIHYQCLFYGGKLLAHLSADDPEQVEDLVKILRVNRNAILIIDSDREKSSDPINATKTRLVKAITESGGMAWVTAGRTIENYLPGAALALLYNKLATPGQFDKFEDVLDGIQPGEGKRFLKNKVQFASRIRSHITKEDASKTLDLGTHVETALNLIRRWNGILIDTNVAKAPPDVVTTDSK